MNSLEKDIFDYMKYNSFISGLIEDIEIHENRIKIILKEDVASEFLKRWNSISEMMNMLSALESFGGGHEFHIHPILSIPIKTDKSNYRMEMTLMEIEDERS